MKHFRIFTAFLLIICIAITLMPISLAAETYYWPVPANRIPSQGYHDEHKALDIDGGGDILATKSGTVLIAYTGCNNYLGLAKGSCASRGICSPNCGYYDNYCNYGFGCGVVIQHSDGSGYSAYAHLSDVIVTTGQTVNRGDKLGTMGATGMSTGNGGHLHFELFSSCTGGPYYYSPTSYINPETLTYSFGGNNGSINVGPGNSGVVITLNPMGGSVSQTSISRSPDGTYGDLPTPTRTGYSFRCWSADQEGMFIQSILPNTTLVSNSPHTIYAHWTANSYTVNLDPCGGFVSTSSISVKYDRSYSYTTTLPTPTREGYTFLGWYTAESGGIKVTDDSTVNIASNHTLYARWESNVSEPDVQIVVTLDSTGGSVTPNYISYTKDTAYGDLPTPQRPGYVFKFWSPDQSGTFIQEITASTPLVSDSSHTLYAHWAGILYIVEFNACGGTVFPPSISVRCGSAYGRQSELPTPVREGYTFLGWYTSSNGGKQITNDTILELPANHTIYAQWDKIEAKTHKIVVDFILEDHIESQLYNVEDGKDLALDLTIPDDMEITDIKIDGVSVGKAAAYTLKNITEDHRVSVYVTSIKEDTPPEPPVISFQDIKPSDWYNTPVNYAASENLIIGYTDNTFRPKNNMQVSEYLTIMYRFCKERCPDLIADRDTTGTDWKAGARYVSSRLLGTKYMDMDHAMTRYEMADITARIMQWLEAYDNLIPNTREPHGFVDVSYHSDPDMYRQVMYLESIYGIDGVKNTDGTYSFKGNNSITRAETAQVLYNIMTKSIN